MLGLLSDPSWDAALEEEDSESWGLVAFLVSLTFIANFSSTNRASKYEIWKPNLSNKFPRHCWKTYMFLNSDVFAVPKKVQRCYQKGEPQPYTQNHKDTTHVSQSQFLGACIRSLFLKHPQVEQVLYKSLPDMYTGQAPPSIMSFHQRVFKFVRFPCCCMPSMTLFTSGRYGASKTQPLLGIRSRNLELRYLLA